MVIPTHQRRDLVLECVSSVLAQTEPPAEVIVVVDGSTDGTAQAIRDIFPAITIIEQPNLGKSIAVNAGVAASRNEWVCLLDDDDMWHRDKLRTVRQYIDVHPDCSALNHGFWLFRPRSSDMQSAFGLGIDLTANNLIECYDAVSAVSLPYSDQSYLNIKGDSFNLLLERNRGAFSCTVLKRSLYAAAGGHVASLACAEDWFLFLSIARMAEWHTLPDRLTFSRQHGHQSTTNRANTASILTAYTLAWHGGRPAPSRQSEAKTMAQLKSLGPQYRKIVREFFWDAVKHGDWRLARSVRLLGGMILPGRIDRLLSFLPPRLARWEPR